MLGRRKRGTEAPSRLGEGEEPGSLSFWKPLSICILGAVVAFYLQFAVKYETWVLWKNLDRDALAELAKEIGIAFMVAAIIMVTLEYNAKRLAHREIIRFRSLVSKDVFKALLGRIVPKELEREVNDVLHSDFVRRGCKYRIILKEPYPGMSKGYFVIRREVTYTVENLLSRLVTFTIRSSHAEDVDLVAAGWDNRLFHLKLFIDEEQTPLKEGVNLYIESDNYSRLEHHVALSPGKSKSVTLYGEEPCLVSAGRNTYLQASVVIGMEVEVLNEYKARVGTWGVQMNHPARAEAKLNAMGSYTFSRAFLPGQGFQINWKELSRQDADVRSA